MVIHSLTGKERTIIFGGFLNLYVSCKIKLLLFSVLNINYNVIWSWPTMYQVHNCIHLTDEQPEIWQEIDFFKSFFYWFFSLFFGSEKCQIKHLEEGVKERKTKLAIWIDLPLTLSFIRITQPGKPITFDPYFDMQMHVLIVTPPK